MELTKQEIRDSIIAENLFVQLFKNRTYPITDKYILSNDIQAINLDLVEVEKEIEELEKKYKPSGKCCFTLDASTSPQNLKTTLISKGYIQDSEYDDIWWFIDLIKYTETLSNQVAKLSEIIKLAELERLLENTELAWWVDVFGNCLVNKRESLTTKVYVGQIEEEVVSTYISACYKDFAIYKGAEVMENYRRQGINTQMMHQFLLDATKSGCKWVIYQTSSTNIASIGTGKKLGFEEAFRRECYCKTL